MSNLSREQLEEIIHKAISEKKSLDEGFIDRVLAKARGNVSQLKGMGSNIKKIGAGVAQGGTVQFDDPRSSKEIAMLQSRISSFEKKINALMVDLGSDMEALFGEGLRYAPESVRGEVNKWGEMQGRFLQATQNLKVLLSKLSGQ